MVTDFNLKATLTTIYSYIHQIVDRASFKRFLGLKKRDNREEHKHIKETGTAPQVYADSAYTGEVRRKYTKIKR